MKDYFVKHFSSETTEKDPIELEEAPEFVSKLQLITVDTIKKGPPDIGEIQSVIKKLKNGKATNDLPTEMLKYAITSEALMLEMENLFTTIWQSHRIPTSWGHSKLVALWKGASKGSIKDPKAYRGLQVGSSLCKILMIIIIDRLRLWYDEQLLEQQQGFRAGRGTADGTYVTKRLQQITDKMRKPLFVLFVDLSAAFDHVERQWLFPDRGRYNSFPTN